MSKNLRSVIYIFFYIGISLAWLKTAEVLSIFGPRSILGMTSEAIPVFWGFIGAALVEGVVAVAFHNLWNIRKDMPTRGMSWLVVSVAAVFSLAMNGLDTFLNMNWVSITEGSAPMLGLRLLTIAIPIVAFMAFGIMMAIDENHPDFVERQQRKSQPQQVQNRPKEIESNLDEEFVPARARGQAGRPRNGSRPVTEFAKDEPTPKS